MNNKRKIVIAVTGASGSIYAKLLFQRLQQPELQNQISNVGVIFSGNAQEIWQYELGNRNYQNLPFQLYDNKNFNAPFASGSAGYDTMIICPCSMGMLGRIAAGVANDLITRAADVILKERRQLILIIRETPLSLIHINNMKTVTEASGIICPAVPSFYSKPTNIEELALTVIDRICNLANLSVNSYRWGESGNNDNLA